MPQSRCERNFRFSRHSAPCIPPILDRDFSHQSLPDAVRRHYGGGHVVGNSHVRCFLLLAEILPERDYRRSDQGVITVSFDFDGVLANSPFAYGVLFPVLDELATALGNRTGATADEARKQIRELIWGKFRRRLDARDYVHAYDWQALVTLAADELGLPFDRSLPQMTEAFAETLSVEDDRSLVYPNAHQTLRDLEERGTCLVMLTNGYRAYQYPTARALGLAGFFSHFYASDDLGSVKPFREAFEQAFSHCGSSNGDRFHVGDSLTQDVAGARGAGIFAIWVHREIPDGLRALSPRERASSAEIDSVVAEKLERENQSALQCSLEECRPDAVVADLNEIAITISS